MTLYTPLYNNRSRAFCGPTAMSAVTGLPVSDIRDAIRQASGNIQTSDGRAFPIMGVQTKDLIAAMSLLGWEVVEKMPDIDYRLPNAERMKPRRFGDFLAEHGNDGPFIVNVTGHYIAVSHGEACDSYTKLPLEIAKWKNKRANRWVQNWWKFAKKETSTGITV